MKTLKSTLKIVEVNNKFTYICVCVRILGWSSTRKSGFDSKYHPPTPVSISIIDQQLCISEDHGNSIWKNLTVAVCIHWVRETWHLNVVISRNLSYESNRGVNVLKSLFSKLSFRALWKEGILYSLHFPSLFLPHHLDIHSGVHILRIIKYICTYTYSSVSVVVLGMSFLEMAKLRVFSFTTYCLLLHVYGFSWFQNNKNKSKAHFRDVCM